MRVIISQRADNQGTYAERRDAVDRSWYAVLRTLIGQDIILFPAPNDPSQIYRFVAAVAPQGIVLTGGNDPSGFEAAKNTEPDRDAVEKALLDHAAGAHLPLLAVCRGFQFLNSYCGGKCIRVMGHVGKEHHVFSAGGYAMSVNSFHTYAIAPDDLAAQLVPLARDLKGQVEAAHHGVHPWLGIMWHPERPHSSIDSAIWLQENLALHTTLKGHLGQQQS